MSRNRRLAAIAATSLIAPLAAVAAPPSVAAPASTTARAVDPVVAPRLWAPASTSAVLYGNRKLASVNLPVRLIAGSVPIELWSTRTAYDEQIRTVVRTPDGDTALPVGSMTTFNAIDDFVSIRVTDVRTGDLTLFRKRDACLNGNGQRVRPDAPARSPYPTYCFSNPYSLGNVQGVQAGWSNPVLGDYGRGLRLPRGRYEVKVSLKPSIATALGIAPDDAVLTMRVIVTPDDDHGGEEPPIEHRAGGAELPADPDGPTGQRLTDPDDADGPRPNLRSLPAWGITMDESGTYLRFAATVWNAGDSPLVVDGFVADTEDRMDAFQYFFDSDGEQTGYQQVGSFEFDRKRTHQHWHFRDFARYTLLRADQSTAVTSKKEAFCLANTDAVDLTVRGADWSPENTDLSTDCGFDDSLSLRQVLAAGWGDTYAQFRAGQSFDLQGLPNGTYFIATIANPRGRLVESDTTDNTALRKVVIGGRPGARTVRVPQVGLIEEPVNQW